MRNQSFRIKTMVLLSYHSFFFFSGFLYKGIKEGESYKKDNEIWERVKRDFVLSMGTYYI